LFASSALGAETEVVWS